MINKDTFTTGIAKSWTRDFGFLREDGTGVECFVHFSAIIGFKPHAFRYLIPGARYVFLKVPSPKIEGQFLGLCVEKKETENAKTQSNCDELA